MSLSSISSKGFFYEKINARSSQRTQENSKGRFPDNLEQTNEKESREDSQVQKEEAGTSTSVQVDYSYGGASSALWIMQNGRVNMSAVFACKARHIAYSDCDSVKVFAAEGYTLKAKVELDAHKVYIEQKNEDGSIYAYEVNPLKLSDNTQNPIEQMAAGAWEGARRLLNDGTFTEIKADGNPKAEESKEEEITFAKWLDQFHDFVKRRIKEGPPKIQIGGSEYSEKDWEKLMRKMDEAIDAYKEELRQRIRKDKDQDAAGKEAGSATETKSLAEVAGMDAGEKDIEEQKKPKESGISEAESIKAEKKQTNYASTSFLARLKGEKKAPYSYLADESGMIVYKGAVFVCDDKKQSICLGDMSDPNNVLNIPLSKGGVLRVHRDNIGDLVKAIDMFSPEDIARILRAIAQDKKVQDMELEIKEMESEDPAENAGSVTD